MILILDIGNSTVTIGAFRKEKLLARYSFSTSDLQRSSDIRRTLRVCLRHWNIKPSGVQGCAISSVVPKLTRLYHQDLLKNVTGRVLVINGAMKMGVKLKYRDPETLGADRICNIVAGYKIHGGPAIIVDLGTATTYDVVSRTGEYLGGAIAPGIATSINALATRTALLPQVDPKFPNNVIGRTTISGIQSGVLYGAVDALEGMISRIRRTTGRQAKVIATGGFSSLISKRTNVIDIIDPALVLHGAYRIFRHVVT